MRKTLSDVASYLKEIMVPDTHEAYAINPAYTYVSTEEGIREGILALRRFLARLYDRVIAEGHTYDNTKKVAHEYENRTSLSVYYPFLHNINTMLISMGYHGELACDTHSLTCDGAMFSDKLSVAKNLECLRFLKGCGMGFDGVDGENKKQALSDIKTIRITYPDDPAMLTGLKVMAIAEVDHRTLLNQDVLLRCDYRILLKEEPDVLSIVRDTIKPLPEDVRDFLLFLHQRYLGKKLTCVVEVKGFHIYIRYCYKRKDVWGLNNSLNNGYHINVKAVKTEEYADTIKTFPLSLQELIAKGYGCGRKREIGRCDGGCRGIPIALDDSILDMRDAIIAWFDREVDCLQRK